MFPVNTIPLNTHGESYDGICTLADLFASLKYPTIILIDRLKAATGREVGARPGRLAGSSRTPDRLQAGLGVVRVIQRNRGSLSATRNNLVTHFLLNLVCV